MTPYQYRTALRDVGLNLTTGAAFLGIDRKTSNRYASGAQAVPTAIGLLLAYAGHKRTTWANVKARASLYLERIGDDATAEKTAPADE